MIKIGTLLSIRDNSNAKSAICLKIISGYKKKTARIGDIIIVSIKSLKNYFLKSKIKKKQVFKAIVIKTKIIKENRYSNMIYFKNNCIILIDKSNNPIGTRILGSIPKKIKKKFVKVFTLSSKKCF